MCVVKGVTSMLRQLVKYADTESSLRAPGHRKYQKNES